MRSKNKERLQIKLLVNLVYNDQALLLCLINLLFNFKLNVIYQQACKAKISLAVFQLLVNGNSFNFIERMVFTNHSVLAIDFHIPLLSQSPTQSYSSFLFA